MEASFWHERWELDQIGFHKNETNTLLINHIDKLKLAKGARIFLPLCGKTLDFAYLQELAYRVVGIELSEVAIEALFEELQLTPTISSVGKLTLYQSENIEVFVGDFFDLSSEVLGQVDATYDRASIVALPHETRQSYTKHLTKVTQTAPQLVVTLEYEQAGLNGPPFSVSTDEFKQHYEHEYSLKSIEKNEVAGGLKGRVAALECVWILQPLNE